MVRLIRKEMYYFNMEKENNKEITTTKVIFDMDKKLDQRFRKVVVKEHGLHRGVIRKSLEDAVGLWLDAIENKDKSDKELLEIIKKRLGLKDDK
jgi:hypothetical protein